jgi:flagellar FliL protein
MAATKKPAAAAEGEVPEKKKSKLKLIIIVVVVLVAAGGYFMMGKSKAAAAGPVKPDPGAVIRLDSVHINLAGGHYLSVGLAILTTKAAAADPPDGAQLLDSAISLFSNRTMAELSAPAVRDKSKTELTADAIKEYPNDVIGVYFTEFVMQ